MENILPEPCWVISSMYSGNEMNLIKVLKLVTETAALVNVRVTLLAEKSDRSALMKAFSLGLHSVIDKPYTKKSIADSFESLIARMEKHQWNDSLVAADFLREILEISGLDEHLIQLEKKLAETFTGNGDSLFNLVKLQAEKGDKTEALSTLKQVKLLYPTDERVAEYHSKYFPDEKLEGGVEDGAANFLKIGKVVSVDSDSAVQNRIKGICEELGSENFLDFSDGESALEGLKEGGEVDLIVQEWRIPKVTGPLFLQRVKAMDLENTAIIVCSSLVKKEDLPLLKEMGVSAVVGKPVDREKLLNAIVRSVQQARQPTERGAMERKMRSLLSQGEVEEARVIKDQYLADKGLPTGMRDLVESEFALVDGDFEKAKSLSISAIKNSGDSILALNILGKALMQLREFDMALKCFEKAKNLSPQNIDRLCSIAEVQSEMGNEDGASEALESVKKVDESNTRISAAEARIALNSGNYDKAQSMMNNSGVLESVVSYMNNQAIAMARCNQMKKSINQYKKTLKSIPEGRDDTKAIVRYNLALAFVRNNELDKALKVLANCIKVESKVKLKATSLFKRVKKAHKAGKTLNIVQSKGKKSSSIQILSTSDLKPGDLACFLIYEFSGDGGAEELLSGDPLVFPLPQSA